jgi:two-component system, cell cycle sensor histidine kinase and response regulator CckA
MTMHSHTRILLVEDEKAVLTIIARLLEKAGYDVVALSHPFDARDYLRGANAVPDLMVTDILMPGLNGFELCDILRERNPGVPVVFMSGYRLENLPAGPAKLPDNSCLVTKPFAISDLRDAIDAMIETHSSVGS